MERGDLMTLNIEMKTRDGEAFAKVDYLGAETVVKAGGKINRVFHG